MDCVKTGLHKKNLENEYVYLSQVSRVMIYYYNIIHSILLFCSEDVVLLSVQNKSPLYYDLFL